MRRDRDTEQAVKQAHSFLETVIGALLSPERCVAIWTLPDKRTRLFTDCREAARYAIERASDSDVYYCTCAVSSAVTRGRGKAQDMVGVLVLRVEIDVSGPGHKAKKLPPDKQIALQVLDSIEPKPAVVVDSGGGLHAYVLLAVPWVFESHEDRRLAKEYARRYWVKVAAAFAQHGWQVDHVHDLPRVLRVVGTVNHKDPDNIRPVKLVRREPTGRYTLQQLDKLLPSAPADDDWKAHVPSTGKAKVKSGGRLPAGVEYPPPPDELISELCALSPAFEATWNLCRPDLTKSNGSADWSRYDATISGIMAAWLYDRNDATGQLFQLIAGTIQAFRKRHCTREVDRNKRRRTDYLARTVGDALAWAARPSDLVDRRIPNGASPGRHEDHPSPAGNERPRVILPGGSKQISASAVELGELLAAAGRFYVWGGAPTIVEWEDGKPKLRIVTPAMLPSVLESVARLTKISQRVLQPAICSEQIAKLILNAEVFIDAFPKIRVVSPVPLLAEGDGDLVQVTGYDERSGILAPRWAIDEVPLDKAIDLLRELLRDFRFATPYDGSRASAAIITPALVLGGLLPGRAPIDLGEADQSQAGKGYRNKITAAPYGQTVKTIAQRRSSVGGIEESFSAALIAGANFICLDNIRGKIDSPAIESFLTEDSYVARMPYSANVEIDPRRTVLMMTSNRAELTPDLANRSSCVLIVKQPPGYVFQKYPDGDILAHVRANQPLYLGAVFALIRAWHTAGKPRTNECRHDFREWAQTLDWIVQNLLDEAPLIEGHRETQDRMSTPALTWLSSVAREVARAERFDEWLRAHQILDIILPAPNVDVPGLRHGADPEDETVREKLLPAMGRRLKQFFVRSHFVLIDRFRIERRESIDDAGRPVREYRFSDTPHDGPHVTLAPEPSSRPPSSTDPPSQEEVHR